MGQKYLSTLEGGYCACLVVVVIYWLHHRFREMAMSGDTGEGRVNVYKQGLDGAIPQSIDTVQSFEQECMALQCATKWSGKHTGYVPFVLLVVERCAHAGFYYCDCKTFAYLMRCGCQAVASHLDGNTQHHLLWMLYLHHYRHFQHPTKVALPPKEEEKRQKVQSTKGRGGSGC